MIKLSIIVPIYGVEQYLRKCVDSLLAQDMPFSEYEIILVDDESLDACPQICDEYARKRPLIRVIHRKNGGLSAARNSGIEVAQGEYLMFVDSDDYIEQGVLSGLMAQVERDNLDVLRYNYQNVRLKAYPQQSSTDGHRQSDRAELFTREGKGEDASKMILGEYEVFEPHKNAKPYFDYSSEIEDGETFLNSRLGYACYAWAFIIRRDLIISTPYTIHHTPQKKNCLFTEGIYFEDTDWTPRMLLRAKRVSSTEKVVYNYLWREGSITLPDNPIKKKKVLEDKIKLLYGFKEHQKEANDRNWFIWQTAGTTMSILGILSTYPSAVRRPYLRQLKSLDIFPLSTYRASKNSRIKILMANVSPSLYCSLISVLNSITR